MPVPKLIKTVRKMPKALKPAEMTDVLYRLKALDAQRPAAPIPKGPMPTSMKGCAARCAAAEAAVGFPARAGTLVVRHRCNASPTDPAHRLPRSGYLPRPSPGRSHTLLCF